jgi:hypothetical protein
MSRIVTTAALAGVLLAGPGIGVCAPAYGGAPLVAAQVQTQSLRGFHLATPDLIASRSGVRVHGLVCRTSTTPATAPRVIRVEHLDASMRVIGRAAAQPSGVLGERRSLGCAAYDVMTNWTVRSSDTVRVLAAS